MKNSPIILIVAILLASGIGFFAGTKYQQNKRPSFMQGNRQFAMGQNGDQSRGNLRNDNQQGSRPISGEIISSDDQSITIKVQDGSTKIVILSQNSAINKAETGTKEDLKTGEKVMIIGTANSDGSITAQNIQLNPVVRNFREQPNQ
jgi:hypothetical protein